MDNINKTLYIPLYGKAFVSKKGIILQDKKAEEIWAAEAFELKGKSKSKWLAYYMGMRSRVYDDWLKAESDKLENPVILHIGCGMDSRAERIRIESSCWYDVDFPDVIKERKRYYSESDKYRMIGADIRCDNWIDDIPKGKNAAVVMEGISMYLKQDELKQLLKTVSCHFDHISILVDCYTTFAAKASKYKNPINDVGVNVVYGIDNPILLEDNTGVSFIMEHNMTPSFLINELRGTEKFIFQKLFGGNISKKMYRLYEYESCCKNRT